jgi:menaquinone-specific isochorismate synthase
MPRLAYLRDERRAWWSLALAADELEPSSFRTRMAELDRARSELVRSHERATSRPRLARAEQRSYAEWQALVDAIKGEIAAGRFEKIVAARRATLELDPAPDALRVLARLREQAPGCTRFAFRRGAATFLGATPERLIARCGDSVETEALAGSIRSGDAARARELLGSVKERSEHELVVRELLGALSPLSLTLAHAEAPVVRELRHVLHLSTPIRAKLREPRHVLELVERLHPTPAVGGVPTADAPSWIAEHEADERGWYAGPIGWFDADGNGEFCVALRAGVLDECRAHLYAGAGIVAGSQAASEWNETRLKLAALLSALGLTPEDLPEERP